MTVSPETLMDRRGKRKKSERWSGVLLALTILAAFALVAPRLIAIATGPPPPGPGVAAPEFSGRLVNGQQTRLSDYRGRIVLLDFWGTWCPPCVASLPHLQRIQDAYAAKNVVVLGVNQDPGQEAKVRGFLDRRNLTFPSVMDPGRIHRSYGVYSFPSSFVIDPQGIIRASFRGPASEQTIRKALDRVVEQPVAESTSAG